MMREEQRNVSQRTPVILAVDDDPKNLAVLRDSLHECGYTILAAEDGESAVVRADYARPDLILLDVMMPGIDGFETCRRLKAQASTVDIPIIFMTALAETGHKVKGLEAGAVDYVTKPFQREELLARIAVHLQIRELTSRLREMNDTLERRVQERTLDLAIANRELEDEIAARQSAQEQLQALMLVLEGKVVELQQTQVALRKSEQKFRAIFDQTFQLIGVLTPEGKVLEANQTALTFCDIKESAIIGMPFWDTPWWTYSADQRDKLRQAVASAAAGDFIRFEAKHQAADGSLCYLDFSLKPLTDESGNVLMLIAEGRDITIINKLERELRQAQKMEAIGTLAAGIAHDFNNILTAIVGNAELALELIPPDSKARFYTERVLQSGMRAAELVKQILTFSRKTEQERKPVLLTTIVAEVLELLRPSIPSTIAIRQEIFIPEGETVVHADPTQIHQVLMNLCTNAAHAMRAHGGELSLKVMEEMIAPPLLASQAHLKPGPHVKLTVRDSGHGIDEITMGRIFDPYFTTKKPGEGTGLGLSVTLGIVQGHGGSICVDSSPGQGTAFHLYLPKAENRCFPTSTPLKSRPLGSEHILLVDDEAVLVEMAQEMLTALGYRVTAETDSRKTLGLFRAAPGTYDLVITDMTMPGLTGRELVRELLAVRPDIPIIMCSGYAEFINTEEALEIGIRDFIMKPYTTDSLAQTIRRVLAS